METIINISFVFAMIVIIQAIKTILKDKKIEVPDNTWKIVVLLLGIPMGTIAQGIDGFPGETIFAIIFNTVIKCFIYSAASSLVYQTGKITLNRFLKGGSDEQ